MLKTKPLNICPKCGQDLKVSGIRTEENQSQTVKCLLVWSEEEKGFEYGIKNEPISEPYYDNITYYCPKCNQRISSKRFEVA
jgi:S-adenosylmethionine synthetase